jgi:hypothetical protein
MKKIIIVLMSVLVVSCSEFLDTDQLTQKDSSNYPQTPEEAYTALMGVYNAFGSRIGNGETEHPFIVLNLMADDMLGGGGQRDLTGHAIDLFKLEARTMYTDLWECTWRSVYRANLLLGALDNVENWPSVEARNKIEGQILFLRAFTYFRLCSLFGPVPLITSPEPVNYPRALPEDIYAQMGADLKRAIEILPDVKFQDILKPENGLATRWAAQALMARIFLFYTCYYNQSQMGDITKVQVIAWVDDCIANSGHDLLPKFGNLWPYSIVMPGKTKSDYKYAADNGLGWIGENGDNNETIFAIKVSTSAQGNNYDRRNGVNLHFGLRIQELLPFGAGWGKGPVSSKFYDEWPDSDPRKKGSVLNLKTPDATVEGPGITQYKWSQSEQWNETGYWSKKYMPINVYDDKGALVSYSSILWNMPNDQQFNSTQDIVLIRFADVLLMGAELESPKAQEYMDRVRARVGLSSVAPTLANIKTERKYELAFEGIRWLDILRWGEAETVINAMSGITVNNNGRDMTYNIRFRQETGGFLPIPEAEVTLSEGILTQTPGWDTNDAMLQPGE